MTILYTKLICDCNTCVLLYTENKIMLLTISIVINRSQLDNSEKCRLYNVIIIRTFNLKYIKNWRERSQLKIIGSSSHWVLKILSNHLKDNSPIPLSRKPNIIT